MSLLNLPESLRNLEKHHLKDDTRASPNLFYHLLELFRDKRLEFFDIQLQMIDILFSCLFRWPSSILPLWLDLFLNRLGICDHEDRRKTTPYRALEEMIFLQLKSS